MDNWLPFLTVLLALATLLLAFRIRQDVREVHLSLNSRLDELVRATGQVQHALGFAEGAEQEKQRVASE